MHGAALVAWVSASTSSLLHAEDLTFSGSGTVRMLATDWADYTGGSGNFNGGVNDWGRLYWRGSSGDGQYMHFNLSRLSGLTMQSAASVTLQNANATWGGGVDGSFIATANGAWNAAYLSGIPGATAIGDATNATGSYGDGASVTWGIGSSTFQSYVDNASTFNGLAIIGGSGSQLHFSGPMTPYLEVQTNATMSGVVTVSGGAAWNSGNYSFTNGVLTINSAVAAGTSGAGAVTINSLGTVLVNGNGGDNHYWAIDSTTVNSGGVLVAHGHSHIHNLTLAGGELGGIRPNGTWGGWSVDDATTVTGGVTSTISAQQINSDNGNFNVDTGSTLNFTGSLRSGSIIKNGSGTMILAGSNGSSGGVTINGGTLIVTKSAQDDGIHTLGTGNLVINDGGTLRSLRNWSTASEWNPTSVGSITINQGGTWSIEAVGQTIYNGLNLNGGSITSTASHGDWGALHLKSNITAGGNAVSSIAADVALNGGRAITVEGGSQLNYSGVIHNQITTTGAITKAGAGTLALSGTNTYTGVTTLEGGIINAASFADNGTASSLGTGTGDSDPNSIGLLFRGGTLQYTGSTAQSTNRQIRLSTIGGGGTIDASGSDPSATLSFTATTPTNFFEAPGSRTLTLTGTNTGNNTFGMAIGEAGGATSLVKNGTGTWVLTGNSSYSGSTTVSSGTLVVNGNISTSTTIVESDGTLGGSGTLGSLNILAGGTLAPGNSPGILNVDGDYSQSGTLSMEITGLTPGTQHDQVNVDRISGDGSVSISGNLNVLFTGGTYVASNLIFILLNDGTDAVSGTFSGLAQNGIVTTYGGWDWIISYNADSSGSSFTGGNDIALMAVPEPRAALLGGLGLLSLLRRRR